MIVLAMAWADAFVWIAAIIGLTLCVIALLLLVAHK